MPLCELYFCKFIPLVDLVFNHMIIIFYGFWVTELSSFTITILCSDQIFYCTNYIDITSRCTAAVIINRVRHLVLVDAWGFVEKPDESEVRRAGRYAMIVPVVQYYSSMFNPFTIIRALGPYG